MQNRLNEDEQMLFEIIGESLFKEVQEKLGGFQIYIQKRRNMVTAKDVKSLLDEGKSKRQICRSLGIAFGQYNRLMKEAIHIK